MSQIKEITELDKKAYKLYIDDNGDYNPVMGFDGFIERKYEFIEEYYKEASWRYRKEKLNKLI